MGKEIAIPRGDYRMNKNEYIFSLDMIAHGILLCIDNAEKLIEESEILLNKERFGRALSLAILSMEELGKVPMLATATSIKKGDNKSKSEFLSKFKNHIAKRENAFIPFWAEKFLELLNEEKEHKEKVKIFHGIEKENEKYPEQYPKEFMDFYIEDKVEEIKMRGFYVDYSEIEKSFISPDSINADLVHFFLDGEKVAIEKYRETWKTSEEIEISRVLKSLRNPLKMKKLESDLSSQIEKLKNETLSQD